MKAVLWLFAILNLIFAVLNFYWAFQGYPINAAVGVLNSAVGGYLLAAALDD